MANTSSKIIIYCPSCKNRVRVPKYKNIVYTCPKCKRQVNYDGRINKKPYIIGAILLVLLLAYLFFFGDYFAYLNVKNKKTVTACSKYYNSYPKGYFLEEVSFIEIRLTDDIELVRNFLTSYPNSDKRKEVLKVNQDLWNNEIESYNKVVKTKNGLDAKAVSFFRSLLEYMRDNNESTIYLNMKGSVDVKNFDQYDDRIKNNLDSIVFTTEKRNVSDNIIDITTNYRKGSMGAYENIVNSAVESGFENILSHNFIKVTSNHKYSSNPLKINIKYDIKNQERRSLDNISRPVIWTYVKGSKNDKQKEEFVSFLIGISINYSFNIKLPESNEAFSFESKTNALDNISNIINIEDGYKRMTAQNFYNYSKVISTKFGLSREEIKEE